MHGQGNYTAQIGQGPCARQTAFPRRPVTIAPPPPPAAVAPPPPPPPVAPPPHPVAPPPPPPPPCSHHGPLGSQPQVIQQGHPSFPLTPYQHTLPSAPHPGPPASVVSSGLTSTHSCVTHPQPQQRHLSTQTSHSYPTFEQQHLPWSQNVPQFSPKAPFLDSSAYPLASSQEHTVERGPHYRPPSHAPPLLRPPNTYGSSSLLKSDHFGPSVLPIRQHSHLQSMGPLLPPPPPPPLPSSPPEVPPLPPSSPPADVFAKNTGSCSLKKDLVNGNNLILEHQPPGKPAEDISVHQIEGFCQHTEKIEPKVELGDVVTHSPADSDMDMEDDITLPDEEKKNSVPNNLNGERISISQDDYMKEQLQATQNTGGHKLPKVGLDGFAVPSALRELKGGSGLNCDFPVTEKVCSEADESGTTRNRNSERPSDVSCSQHGNLSKPSASIVYAEPGYGKLSGQVIEGTNPFNLLQDYASDDTSENESKDLLGDVSAPSNKDGNANCDAEKGHNFGPEFRLENQSQSNKPVISKSMIESANVMEAEKMSMGTGKVGEFSDKSPRGRESVSLQPKDSLRNYDADIGCESANLQQPDIKDNSTKLNVDEFGRLVREGVSDSESSDSARYMWKHAKRDRKRKSQSRSRSPHDRRKRSLRRRKERHSRSRSLSPKRRRGRNRSPVTRHELRREKGQLPECFDFIRGKCYRGATCRYSHHESDRGGRRYNRGKQQYRDEPSLLWSPDFHEESNLIPDKEVKHKGARIALDMADLKELKNSNELPVDSTTRSCDKDAKDASALVADVVASNLSGYSAHMPSGKENSLIPESPARCSDKINRFVDQRGKNINDSLVSESAVMKTSVATLTYLPADKSDVKQDPTFQMQSLESPIMKSFFTGEDPSQSLKELPSSVASHQSQLSLPLPSVSQGTSAHFTQSLTQDINLMPPIARCHLNSENYSPYTEPVSYQHSDFPGSSKTSSSSYLLPPAPPQHCHSSRNITTEEHSISSQHMQQTLLPPRDSLSSYTSVGWEPDKRPYVTSNFTSSLTGQEGGLHIRGEDRLPGHPVQGMNPLPQFAQAQPNSTFFQSPLKGMWSSVSGNLPSDGNSPCSRPYFLQASYGLQYSPAGASAQLGDTGKVISSISNIIPDFLERNQPTYACDFVGSRISNHFNPYASTFDHPLSSKFSSNSLTRENELTINTRHGVQFGSSSVPVNGHKIGSVGSKNMISLSSSGLPAESFVPRPGGDQYDPLFDSIEPASNSFNRADHQKHETIGDSDDVLRVGESGRPSDMEGIKQEGGTAVSANDSPENEEYGETADAEVGAVTGSPSNPNDATDMNAGEVEIDQVKVPGKKKKGRERSMKLFKISIATFVKEVLKPSWRQGNMSKEAFKTIVKKTVDKVSGAMKSHRIPRSQPKINQYIDSSRGKLTKLVMGYVDKYVKV